MSGNNINYYITIILIGLFFIVLAIFDYLKEKRKRERWLITKGKVIALKRRPCGSNAFSRNSVRINEGQAPQISFRPLDNEEEIIFVSRVVLSRGQYKKGNIVKVLYNPDDPLDCEIESTFRKYDFALGLLIPGAILPIIGVAAIIYDLKL